MTSDWVVVKRGCLQGSTFGPLIWNIFKNDMPNIKSDAGPPEYKYRVIFVLVLGVICTLPSAVGLLSNCTW